MEKNKEITRLFNEENYMLSEENEILRTKIKEIETLIFNENKYINETIISCSDAPQTNMLGQKHAYGMVKKIIVK